MEAVKALAKRIINETDSDDTGIFGYVDERYFEITKERPTDNWYIVVVAPCGMHDYDGYWRDSADRSLEEAVEEAISGACIIDSEQQDGGRGGERCS